MCVKRSYSTSDIFLYGNVQGASLRGRVPPATFTLKEDNEKQMKQIERSTILGANGQLANAERSMIFVCIGRVDVDFFVRFENTQRAPQIPD